MRIFFLLSAFCLTILQGWCDIEYLHYCTFNDIAHNDTVVKLNNQIAEEQEALKVEHRKGVSPEWH